MSREMELTLMRPKTDPDIIRDSLLKTKIDRLRKDPKEFREFQKAIDESEAIYEISRELIENLLKMKIMQKDKSPQAAKLLQIYATRYLKMNPSDVWPMDGKYWPKTRIIEKIISDSLAPQKTNENESSKEIKSLLLKDEAMIEVLWPEGPTELFSPEMLMALEGPQASDKFSATIWKFKEYIKTPEWKTILERTLTQFRKIAYYDQFNLPEDNQNNTSSNNKNKESIKKSFEIQEKFIKEIQDEESNLKSAIIWAQMKHAGDRGNVMWHHSNIPLQKDISSLQEKYHVFLRKHMNSMSKEYLKALSWIEPRSDILIKWWYHSFKIWDMPIDLNLDGISEGIRSWKLDSNTKISAYIDANADRLIVDTNWERLKKWMTTQWENVKKDPQKFSINVFAVFCWWVWATLLATETWWIWILQAWFAFTAIHDAVKTLLYANLSNSRWEDILSWMEEAIWYKKWMPLSEYYKNKFIELSNNTALFWVFRMVEKGLWLSVSAWWGVNFRDVEKFINHSFKDWIKHEYLWDILKYWWIKAWISASKIWLEASAFTLYQIEVNPYEKAIIDTMGNRKEWKIYMKTASNEVREMSKPENMWQLMMYNGLFVTTLKASFKWSEHLSEFSNAQQMTKLQELMSRVDTLTTQKEAEMTALSKKWYMISKDGITWKTIILNEKGKPVDPKSKDLIKLRNINLELLRKQPEYLSLVYYIYRPVIDKLKMENDSTRKKAIDLDSGSEKTVKKAAEEDFNNWRTWSGTNPRDLKLSDLKLVDFVKWLANGNEYETLEWGVQISSEFANLMRNVYNIKSKKELDLNISKAVESEIVNLKKKISEAKNNNQDHLEIEINWKPRKVKIEELELIMKGLEKKMKKGFRDALKLGIKWKRLPDKYWDPVKVEKMINLYVENINDKLFIEMWWDQKSRLENSTRQQELDKLLNKMQDGK
ncbi:MAG: hypothetical protein ACD_2C00121G0002 [uncultured bacterium (gcode 4)]|uniref:Uncharacterized protein n=1 Tax=uncultured bacterium (gcode 4) TaxID=1234023 RepID=K2GH07_9BACT|nr:MAG: hypothetical protein ACD_2C00121G0002 [uncultured bacterium (gcode 4)]